MIFRRAAVNSSAGMDPCYLTQQITLGIEYEVGRDRPYAVFACQGFPGRFVDVVLGRDEIFVHKVAHLLFEKTSRSIALQGPHQVAYKSMKTNLS